MSSYTSLLALALASKCAYAAMGQAFSTGPVSDNTFIREATSTLTLPKAPSDSSGSTSLWVGMGTSNGDLIQSIADNWQSNDWSVYAYTLMSTGDNSQMPVQDDPTTASAGDKITMHYKFDDNSGNYTQTVQLNGKTVSTLSTSDGKAQGWGSSVECAEENCGTVGAHTWSNTKIILDSADPDFIKTVAKGQGVTGDMSTSDNGKTWTVSTIHIPEFTFGQ